MADGGSPREIMPLATARARIWRAKRAGLKTLQNGGARYNFFRLSTERN